MSGIVDKIKDKVKGGESKTESSSSDSNMAGVGDPLPSVQVQEGAPDKFVDLSKELKNGVIVGVPGMSKYSLVKH